MKNPAAKRVFYILLMVLLLVLIIVVVAAITVQKNTEKFFSGKNPTESMTEYQDSESSHLQQEEKWQEGMIQYNNRNYQYNNQLKIAAVI